MISTSSLSYTYPGAAPLRFPDLRVEKKESLLILGPSGVGKTTLMHLMAGLLLPLSGNVDVNGVRLNELSAKDRDRFRGKHIGLIFQRPHFIKTLNVLENLLLVQNLAGLRPSKTRCLNFLHRLNLEDKAASRPYSLSQGEQQRVGIAMALINAPALVLADEPTSSLDDTNAEKVIDLLQQQTQQAGAALAIITHDSRLRSHFSKFVEL